MSNLWLANRKYDLAFFHLPALVALLALVPQAYWGKVAVLPTCLTYFSFFELPHVYLTWSAILPRNAGKTMNMDLVRSGVLTALALCLLIPLSSGTDFQNWLLTGLSLLSIWHVYRQHQRICAVYDEVQARRENDLSIFEDRRPMRVFFAMAAFGGLAWSFTRPELEFALAPQVRFRFVHPMIPWEIFRLYAAVTAMAGGWAFKRGVIDRARDVKFIPWPQVSLTALALVACVGPFFMLPLESLPLAFVVPAVFHNVQHFGFVWLYERQRSDDLPRYPGLLGVPQRLVRERAWRPYVSLSLGFAACVMFLYIVVPRPVGAFLLYFVAVSHYVVDLHAWKAEHNGAVPRVIDRLAGIALDRGSRLRRVI